MQIEDAQLRSVVAEVVREEIAPLVRDIADVKRKTGDLADQVAINTKNITEQATALTAVSNAAAVAAEIATKTMSRMQAAHDEITKMVTSALTIQRDAIERMVTASVTGLIEPIAKQVEGLEAKHDAQELALTNQSKVLSAQDEQLVIVVKLLSTLSKWSEHWAFKVGLFLGGLISGAIGYWLPR